MLLLAESSWRAWIQLTLAVAIVTLPALAQSLPEPADLVELSLMPHGIFVAGLALNQATTSGPELTAIGNLRFGLFNRIEIQATSVQEIENYSSRQLTLGAKVQLWQEQRHVPKAIIGLSSQSRYQIFLTKIFNLPRIHTFQLYGGFRYLFSQSDSETKAIGFLGWQKQVQPALINGDLIFRLGTDFGSSGFSKAYLITRLITQTGLWVDLQLAGDTKLAQIQGSVSWSNQQLLAQIESVKRLAKNVSRLRQRQQNQNSD